MLWSTTIAATAGYKAPILIASTCQGHMLWDNTIAATAGYMAPVLIASICLGSHAVGHYYSCYSWLHGCCINSQHMSRVTCCGTPLQLLQLATWLPCSTTRTMWPAWPAGSHSSSSGRYSTYQSDEKLKLENYKIFLSKIYFQNHITVVTSENLKELNT